MSNKRIIVIGDVYTDFHLDFVENELRLGGVFHSARALNALKTEYFLAMFAADYQKNHVIKWTEVLKCSDYIFLGFYTNRPNVMLINESCEIGNQGYRSVLYNENEIKYSTNEFSEFVDKNMITDAIVYPGDYEVSDILNVLRTRRVKIHMDVQYSDTVPTNIETLIVSTSSEHARNGFQSLIDEFKDKGVRQLLFKENRGGTRLYDFSEGKTYSSPAYKVDTIHSVGVGDVFNAVLASSETPINDSILDFSSRISAVYASTIDHDEFIHKTNRVLKSELDLLPYPSFKWEDRRYFKIYLASPDFPNTETRLLANLINEKLTHHNFLLLRPIIENGFIDNQTSSTDRCIIYGKDLQQLSESNLCIALLDELDTGTATEVGICKAMNIPVIGFCKLNKNINNFLSYSLDVITDNLLDLIENIFMHKGRKL